MLENIKKEFSTRTLVLIPIAIVINIVIGELTVRLKLPIYLDSIGTVLVGAIAGPWAGALTGALANLIWGLFNPYAGRVLLCRGRNWCDGRPGRKKRCISKCITPLALHHHWCRILFLIDCIHPGLYKFHNR